MKVLFVLVALMSSLASAAEGESCLVGREKVVLLQLKEKLAKFKAQRPGCEHGIGGSACISPFDQSFLNYLLKRESGDTEICQNEEIGFPSDYPRAEW